jgi:hypothetical protein
MMKLRWWRVDASEVAAVTAMGVWEAVLAGGGRRFIKRKDSDAGETGSCRRPLLLPTSIQLPTQIRPFCVLCFGFLSRI